MELLLTPLQFGIPNSRLRYYLLAKFKPLSFSHLSTDENTRLTQKVWRHIPGHHSSTSGAGWVDPRLAQGRAEENSAGMEGVSEIRNFLDPASEEESPFKIPDRVLEKWGRLFDIVLPSSRRSCCFTRGYTKLAERAGSILQMNDNLNTTEVFDKFLAAQKSGDANAVRILDPLQLRYFSPAELLRVFCFSDDESAKAFQWPEGISVKTQYRLIGNGVNVKVVAELIKYLFDD